MPISSDILLKMKEFYAKEYPNYTDVTFICRDNKHVKGHKILLAMLSDAFSQLFKREPETNVFYINEFDSDIMEWIVKAASVGDLNAVPFHLDFAELIPALKFFNFNYNHNNKRREAWKKCIK